MLEIILIGVVIFLILTFFYKQAVCEFRFNQIEWGQKDKLGGLFQERVPIVVRGIPKSGFWTHEDVIMRESYNYVPVFEDQALSQWIVSTNEETICPWEREQAERISSVSGLPVWAERTINTAVQTNPFFKVWLRPSYFCWSGQKGLFKTTASWSVIFVTEGSVVVTIMPENVESSLPPAWKGCFPTTLTAHDTPFIGDLKFVDIILRPGNCLLMPSHWFVSWTSAEGSNICPMVCSIEYHTPISKLADRASS